MTKFGSFINAKNPANPIKWQVVDTDSKGWSRVLPARSENEAEKLAEKLNDKEKYERWQVLSIGVED